ncbi:MAG TPA: hypothetical protein PKV78_04585 [Methanoculleus thermophilus]|nr:hypothetical protein [Methanoculleus thermophilus]
MRYYGTITGLESPLPAPSPAEREEAGAVRHDWLRSLLLIVVVAGAVAAFFFLTKEKKGKGGEA